MALNSLQQVLAFIRKGLMAELGGYPGTWTDVALETWYGVDVVDSPRSPTAQNFQGCSSLHHQGALLVASRAPQTRQQDFGTWAWKPGCTRWMIQPIV